MKDEKMDNDLDTFDSSVLCSESFESMKCKHIIFSILLYVFCVCGAAVLMCFSPDILYTKKSSMLASKSTKEILLQLKLGELKKFHRTVQFCLQMNGTKKRSMSVAVTGSVRLRKFGQLVREFAIENSAFLLSTNEVKPIFDSGKFAIDEIVANLNIISADSYFDSLNVIWNFENASWMFFSVLIRLSIFVIIILLFIKFKRAMPTQQLLPTYMEDLTSRMSLLLAICFAPIPEVLEFFNINKLEAIYGYFEFISSLLILAYMFISAWDLSIRNSEKEPRFVEIASMIVLVIAGFLSIPHAIKFAKPEIQDFLENWLPLFLIVIFTFSLSFIPDKINSNNPEFYCSLLHFLLILLPVLSHIYRNVKNHGRSSKMGLFSFLVSFISFVFIFFLHWPLANAGPESSYSVMPESRRRTKQKSDDDDDKKHVRARKVVMI